MCLLILKVLLEPPDMIDTSCSTTTLTTSDKDAAMDIFYRLNQPNNAMMETL